MDRGIEELIKAGEKIIQKALQEAADEQQKTYIFEKKREIKFIQLLSEILPKSVHTYLEFECWHNPDYYSRLNMWNAQALIRIPEMALIRIYCEVRGDTDNIDQMTVKLYDRNADEPFAVLEWRVEYNDLANEYYMYCEKKWEGKSLPIALVNAQHIGDNFLTIQEDVDQRNRERPITFKPKEVVLSTAEILLNALKEFIADEIRKERNFDGTTYPGPGRIP